MGDRALKGDSRRRSEVGGLQELHVMYTDVVGYVRAQAKGSSTHACVHHMRVQVSHMYIYIYESAVEPYM